MQGLSLFAFFEKRLQRVPMRCSSPQEFDNTVNTLLLFLQVNPFLSTRRQRMRRSFITFVLAFMAVLYAGHAMAQDLATFEKHVTVKVLKNGLTVVLCERPEAPVFSFFTIVDVGSAQDPQGESGLAHMFEHEAFKGTDRIGTTDYAKEKVAQEKVEQAWRLTTMKTGKKMDATPRKLRS